MVVLSAGTILAILGIAFAVLSALCNLGKECLDGRDGLQEELRNNAKRNAARAARKAAKKANKTRYFKKGNKIYRLK